MRSRVVITGLGPVTSIGIGKEAFWRGALEGRSGGRKLDWPESILATCASRVGAPVTGFDPVQFGIPPKDVEILDPATQFALAGTFLALADAGISISPGDPRRSRPAMRGVDPERVAVILGTGIGGITTTEESHGRWSATRNRSGIKRYSLPMLIPNAPAAQIAIRYGALGECKTITTACAAGAMAIGDAYRHLRDGEADVAISGGTEALLTGSAGYALMGFDLIRTLTTRNESAEHASRPWDRDRDGFLLGEGAGIVILERLDFARARGARIYAEVAAYDTNCDGYSMMKLAPDGARIASMLRAVIGKASQEPADVAYINAHGTSTIPNDRIETRVFHEVFGAHAASLAVSSTKSMTGHAVGASGAIEAIATTLTIAESVIPPTINLEHPDPECDLDYVPLRARPARCPFALTTSYGFGGHNAALALRRL
jgi:3-oxoacyl-[acyl-carrier-protein] synthase II